MEPVQNRRRRAVQQQQAARLRLRQTQTLLEQSQTQLHQAQGLLAQYRTQLAQTEMVLTQVQTQLEQQTHLAQQARSELDQAQQQLVQQTSRLRQAHYEQEQARMRQRFQTSRHAEYQMLVWEAWYAYQTGNLAQMAEHLKQAIARSPFPRTETVMDWLAHFAQFAAAANVAFDAHALSRSAAWQQLVSQRFTTQSSVLAGVLARSQSFSHGTSADGIQIV